VFLPRQKAQRRLTLIALIGVGLPVIFLAGFGAYQTRHVQSFLSETTSEYGGYATGLVAQSLSSQISTRVGAVSEYARMAASWGGSSGRYLQLLASQDPLLTDPFLIPDSELLRAAEGETIVDVETPTPTGGEWSEAYALAGAVGNQTIAVHAPIGMWRDVIGTVYDTVFVVPATMDERPLALAPLIGFGGRVVGVAGWHMNPDVLNKEYFKNLVETEVFEEPRTYGADQMSQGLSIAIIDDRGETIYRSRKPSTKHAWAESMVGPILPGWRVAVGPSKESTYVSVQQLVMIQYVALFFLVVASLAALWFSTRQAGEEIQLAESKTSFLANVSHELKTPLALIRLAGETMELGRVRSEEERQKFLQIITRECRRLTHMINNVLNFAKIEAGRKEFHFHTTDLRRVVHETLETFERQFEEKGFEVHVDVPGDVAPIEADSEAVTQCLVNLIDNAMKYSDEQRYVAVRVRVDEPEADGDRGKATISVTDHGMGINPHEKKRIFDKFTRAESGLVHNVRGSGLGLSLVRHIVQAHEGRIELQSTPGRGSTFTLVLPVRQDSRVRGRT
jgi:signal transduction histidine kinase